MEHTTHISGLSLVFIFSYRLLNETTVLGSRFEGLNLETTDLTVYYDS